MGGSSKCYPKNGAPTKQSVCVALITTRHECIQFGGLGGAMDIRYELLPVLLESTSIEVCIEPRKTIVYKRQQGRVCHTVALPFRLATILYNESKHNILLALVSKANKCTLQQITLLQTLIKGVIWTREAASK